MYYKIKSFYNYNIFLQSSYLKISQLILEYIKMCKEKFAGLMIPLPFNVNII
jgi:hypothetical protein